MTAEALVVRAAAGILGIGDEGEVSGAGFFNAGYAGDSVSGEPFSSRAPRVEAISASFIWYPVVRIGRVIVFHHRRTIFQAGVESSSNLGEFHRHES